MKINTFLLRAALVTGAALLLAPISVTLSASLIAVTGLLAIAGGDYARVHRPRAVAAVARQPSAAGKSDLRLAA